MTDPTVVETEEIGLGNSGGSGGRSLHLRFAAMLALVLFSLLRGRTRLCARAQRQLRGADEGQTRVRPDSFPLASAAIPCRDHGTKTSFTGPLVFHWAEYVPDDGGTRTSRSAVSPVLGSHDTLVCHSRTRRRSPLARPDHVCRLRAMSPVNFSGSLLQRWRDPVSGGDHHLQRRILRRVLERSHPLRFVYSKPTTQALLSQDPQRPIPILIRAETIDTTLPPDSCPPTDDRRYPLLPGLRRSGRSYATVPPPVGAVSLVSLIP